MLLWCLLYTVMSHNVVYSTQYPALLLTWAQDVT